MAKQRNSLRAGIFMLISLAMVIFVVIAISGAGRFTQTYNTYVVAFSLADDIGGLRVGDDVRIGGLKVGSIRDIQIRQADAGGTGTKVPSILIYLDLPARFPIGKDAYVSVQKGITGAADINFEDIGSGAQLTAADYLSGHPDALTSFENNLGKIGPDLRETVANLKVGSAKVNTDLDKFGYTADSFTETGHAVHDAIPDLVGRYREVTAAAVKMLDVISNLLGPSTTDFHTTVANLSKTTTVLSERISGLVDQVSTVLHDVDMTVQHANSAVGDVQVTLANTKELTGSVRDVVVDNKSKLAGIITSLSATSENLKYASAEIRHSPWRLLYQPKPDEVGNLNIYDSMRQFAEGADSLDNAAGALRDALKNKNADPAEIRKLMQALNDSFDHFQNVQQKLWSDVKE